MAVTVGNVSNSSDPGAVTSYSWSHTCAANTTCLVVAVSAVDSTSTDRPVSGITYNGVALSKAREFNSIGASQALGSIWYLANPTTGSSLTIEVTHAGKCTDTSAGAVDLLGTSTAAPFTTLGDDDTVGTVANSYPITVSSIPTGSLMVACMTFDSGNAANISPTVGTGIYELDIGAIVTMAAYASESGGAATVTWTTTVSGDGNGVAAVFEPPSASGPAVIESTNTETRNPAAYAPGQYYSIKKWLRQLFQPIYSLFL